MCYFTLIFDLEQMTIEKRKGIRPFSEKIGGKGSLIPAYHCSLQLKLCNQAREFFRRKWRHPRLSLDHWCYSTSTFRFRSVQSQVNFTDSNNSAFLIKILEAKLSIPHLSHRASHGNELNQVDFIKNRDWQWIKESIGSWLGVGPYKTFVFLRIWS